MRKPSFGKLSTSLRGMGSMRPMGFPLSVEFGVGSLKVLQLGPGDTPEMVAAAQLDTPDDLLDNAGKRIAFQMEALPKLIRKGKFKTNRAVCAVPSGQMICKNVQVVPSSEIPIEKLAASVIGSQLNCDPNALLVRCRQIEGVRPGGKSEVVCFAAARDFVARLMGAIKDSKLEPVGIHNEFVAAIRAIDSIAQPGEPVSEADGSATLVLDLGVGATKAMIIHGTRLVFARSIELGSRHLDEAIVDQLGCTFNDARRTRLGLTRLMPAAVAVGADGSDPEQSAEALPGTSGEPDLSEPLEILIDEASMSLRYHRSLFPDRPVEKVVFLGGESRHRLVCEHLARSLRLAAQSVDPLARLARSGKVPSEGVDVTAPQPGWAVPVGMCLSPTDL
ncbi:MAG: pilus assembly protein PilM [Phycisphaerales bacterium]